MRPSRDNRNRRSTPPIDVQPTEQPRPDPLGSDVIVVCNHYGRVYSRMSDGSVRIVPPPRINFVAMIDRRRMAAAIRSVDSDADVSLSDMQFAIPEHADWIELQLWTKRFLHDIGYRYIGDRRDCNAFARIQRTAFDLLGDTALAGSPTVGGMYAHLDEPFAGVTDGYHALNISQTSLGGFASEPQGLDLHYQRIGPWAQTRRIAEVFSD